MKRAKTIFLLSIIICSAYKSQAQAYKIEQAFTLNESSVVEGMTYDPLGKNFYFGEDHNFRILRYTFAGKPAGFIDASKDGMTAVLGMTVSTQTHQLWVCGAIREDTVQVQCVFQYDLKDGKLIRRYPDTSRKAKLFNDVGITDDGSVFVTDTYTKSLFKVDPVAGVAVQYLQDDLLQYGNGIKSHGKILYVSAARGIARVNTESRTVALAPLEDWLIVGNDGLYYHTGSLVAIQNVVYPPAIVRYYLDSSGTKIRKGEVLSVAHPSFVIPTTGVIVDDTFYFMGNNNLKTREQERTRITVMKLRLTPSARVH